MPTDEIGTASEEGGQRSLARLVGMCMVIGLVAGLGAAGFLVMLETGTSFCMGYLANYHPGGPGFEKPPAFLDDLGTWTSGTSIVRWMLLVLPAAGGLLSGVLIFTLAPETEGHGTDAAIQAYHFKDGAIRTRAPFVKALTAMITIGSGGSGGREGPIAQIGAGFGSMLGRWLKVPPYERRVLMASGMAAGIGAIFHAPLAGALVAAEILYRDPDFEHEVLVPSFLSSIVAYSVFGAIFGFHPLFKTPDYVFNDVALLLPYGALAVVSALGAMLFVRTFYGVRGFFFERLTSVPNHVKPAIGGLFVGVIGFFLPEALGAGYSVVQMCFDDKLMALPSAEGLASLFPNGIGFLTVPALLLVTIGLAKIVTTSLTIGSGGSGGVFGPAVIIGGAFGGAVGMVCADLFPGLNVEPGAFALVGMAGFFAGAANTPVSTIIMVNEMTGNYNLLIPSMMVCIMAYMLCRGSHLYREQLPSRLDAPSKIGSMAGAVLKRMTVGQALRQSMDSGLIVVSGDLSFPELLKRYTASSQDCFPIVDEQSHLTGVIDANDIRGIVTETGISDLIIARDVARPAATVTGGDSLLAALNKLQQGDTAALIVVNETDEREVVGTLSRGDIIAAYRHQIVSRA